MNKYYIEILMEKWNHAGTKARSDLAFFLEDMEVTNLVFDEEISRMERILFTKKKIKRKLNITESGDMIILSHRLFLGEQYSNYLIKTIKEKGLRSVLVIHDIESLRQNFTEMQIKEEIKKLNMFDVVVSHNEVMSGWLISNGFKNKLVNLEMFDYHNPSIIKENVDKERKVIFAGNLEKSTFLTKIKKFENKIALYGPNPASNYPNNIDYYGSFTPKELPLVLEGSYGLIWDGDSTEKCTGLSGNYLKYNNPHKTSLYLSCGLPVIIWKEAALASFIEEHKLGLCVNSLEEMDQKLSKINDEEYNIMKNNALSMANKVRNGFFTKEAIKKAESILVGDF